jgi:hypothetical protein
MRLLEIDFFDPAALTTCEVLAWILHEASCYVKILTFSRHDDAGRFVRMVGWKFPRYTSSTTATVVTT